MRSVREHLAQEERPTSMDGFSFKITNTLNYPIYEKKGLKGESIKMASVPSTP
jgi:hypothetical protein